MATSSLYPPTTSFQARPYKYILYIGGAFFCVCVLVWKPKAQYNQIQQRQDLRYCRQTVQVFVYHCVCAFMYAFVYASSLCKGITWHIIQQKARVWNKVVTVTPIDFVLSSGPWHGSYPSGVFRECTRGGKESFHGRKESFKNQAFPIMQARTFSTSIRIAWDLVLLLRCERWHTITNKKKKIWHLEQDFQLMHYRHTLTIRRLGGWVRHCHLTADGVRGGNHRTHCIALSIGNGYNCRTNPCRWLLSQRVQKSELRIIRLGCVKCERIQSYVDKFMRPSWHLLWVGSLVHKTNPTNPIQGFRMTSTRNDYIQS